MSEICWLEGKDHLEAKLLEMGFSKQEIKRSKLKKKERGKIIRRGDEFRIPPSLFNRAMIYPLYENKMAREPPRIREKDRDILVVYKPSLCHIHPLHYLERDNILSFLRERGEFSFLQDLSCEEKKSYDRGLLYRLDYETSGLVLLTNKREVYKKMREGELVERKEYLALVQGNCSLKDGFYEHWISTSGTKIREFQKGKKARIKLMKLAEDQRWTLFKVELGRGYRHQIRVQFSLLGFPLVGDILYGGEESERFGLHCFCYKFKDGRTFYDESFWGASHFKLRNLTGEKIL